MEKKFFGRFQSLPALFSAKMFGSKKSSSPYTDHSKSDSEIQQIIVNNNGRFITLKLGDINLLSIPTSCLYNSTTDGKNLILHSIYTSQYIKFPSLAQVKMTNSKIAHFKPIQIQAKKNTQNIMDDILLRIDFFLKEDIEYICSGSVLEVKSYEYEFNTLKAKYYYIFPVQKFPTIDNEEYSLLSDILKTCVMWNIKHGGCLLRRGFVKANSKTEEIENKRADFIANVLKNENEKILIRQNIIGDSSISLKDVETNRHPTALNMKFNFFKAVELVKMHRSQQKPLLSIFSTLIAKEYLLFWINQALNCCYHLQNSHIVIIEDGSTIRISAALGSLVKIILDSICCKVEGFISLIQTTWINLGCFFINETDHKDLFYFWLICVKFLIYLAPEEFQFTPWLIDYIIKHMYSGYYFPFEADNILPNFFDSCFGKNFINKFYSPSSTLYAKLERTYMQDKKNKCHITFESNLFQIPEFQAKEFVKHLIQISTSKLNWYQAPNTQCEQKIPSESKYTQMVLDTYFDPDFINEFELKV